MFREVGCAFIDVHKLYQLRIEMRISECAIGHERVIEMPGIFRVSFEGKKIVDLRLNTKECRKVSSRVQFEGTDKGADYVL